MKQAKIEIEKNLSILLNQRCKCIGRAGNLLWIGFGEDVTVKNMKGEEKIVSKYTIHVSCTWRMILKDKIILASGDFYIPRAGIEEEDFDWEEFGESRFDEIASLLSEEISKYPIYVSSVVADDLGGLVVSLKGDFSLEIFPDNSCENWCEYWRFIESGVKGSDSHHFVVFDD